MKNRILNFFLFCLVTPGPLLSFSVFSLGLGVVFAIVERADAVFQIVFEFTCKTIAVCVLLGALAVHLSVVELSFVGGSVGVGHNTVA